MKNICVIVVLFIFEITNLNAQNDKLVTEYEYSKFRFVGFKEEKPVYQCNYRYDEPVKNAFNFAFYQPVIYKADLVGFSILAKNSDKIWVNYFDGENIIFEKSHGTTLYLRNKSMEHKISTVGNLNIYNKTHCLNQSNYFYFSTEINKINYLARIDLSVEKPKMKILPVKGKNPILLNEWLFYEIDYISPKYSDPPEAIYRVKTGDWYHPERIVNNVEFSGAVIDTNLISFGVYDRDKWRKVTYNISYSTYIEKQISSLIKYKGKKYQRTLCKNPKTGKTQLCFEELPELPDKFPYKLDRDIESNHNYFHLPHTEKPFTGTFITDRLMFYAGKDELQNLSKSQLRILRNAFYAREGYDFKSADLRELFSQFDWYKKTLERRKIYDLKNEDIFIPSCNMERINLILEVERNK